MHRFLPALVRAHGHALSHLDVTDRPRTAGRSKYGFWNRAFVGLGDLLAIWWLIRRSRRPGTTADVTPARGDRASQA
jgi:dolichol-phosphate mannosyltransferase